MRPDQLADLRIPSDPQVAPDGRRVAFVVTRPDLDDDRYGSRIWIWDGATEARPLTAGPSDATPRWSPDGTRIAFLRCRDDQPAQVAILPIDGGEATIVTEFDLGVTEIVWAPDAKRIAVVATTWTAPWADLDDDERARRPRRIDRFGYRFDGRGWLDDRRSHIWLVDPDGGDDPMLLTPGDFDESQVVWAPDGTELAFTSARHPTRMLDPGTQIWTVAAVGGDPVPVTDVGTWSLPSYDRSGRLHVIGLPGVDVHPNVYPLWRIEPDGSMTALTGELDRNIAPFSPPLSPPPPRWLDDGSALAYIEDRGTVGVIRIHPDARVERVVDGPRVVTGIDPTPDGTFAALVITSPTDPGELYRWDGSDEPVAVTSLNEGFRRDTQLVEPAAFTIEHDGVRIDGWVYLPEGDEQVPVLVNIHGGPATQYGYGFFDEFQVYVEAGYGVVATNPRGSSGYGVDHVRAVVGRWTEERPPDLVDLLAAPDAAVAAFERLDPDRMGVMGGSYGGLATIRVLAEDHRYRSAVAERGLYSWTSFTGTSDIGPWFDRVYLGSDPLEGWPTRWAASPLAMAHRVETPTLIVHSEQDWRCPIEQAEQLFAVFVKKGLDTAFVRFPGEGHELSRGGKPRHRVERFEAILDWHATHLM